MATPDRLSPILYSGQSVTSVCAADLSSLSLANADLSRRLWGRAQKQARRMLMSLASVSFIDCWLLYFALSWSLSKVERLFPEGACWWFCQLELGSLNVKAWDYGGFGRKMAAALSPSSETVQVVTAFSVSMSLTDVFTAVGQSVLCQYVTH